MTAPSQLDDHLLVLQGRIASLPLDPALAREALRIEMENYSENYWCAGWIRGLEFELWRQVTAIRQHGTLIGARPEAYACMLLAEIAGGWWYWPDEACTEGKNDTDRPCFINVQSWLARYDEHLNRQISD
jgi:hypothetical protein